MVGVYLKHNATELYHYGMPRRSGRYPYGSGERPYQHGGPSKSNANKGAQNPAVQTVLNKLGNKRIGMVSPELLELGMTAIAFTTAILVRKLINKSIEKAAVKAINESYKKDIERNRKNNDLSHIPKIQGEHSETEDMLAINSKGYKSGAPEYRMNCTMCSSAYELRRRGYDVQANSTAMGRKEEDVLSWFNMTRKDINTTKSYDDFYRLIHKEPDGSRGQVLTGVGEFDSRHSMIWEKTNGHIVIRDCQSGITYDTMNSSIINKKSDIPYWWFRTDDKQINFDKINDAVKIKR